MTPKTPESERANMPASPTWLEVEAKLTEAINIAINSLVNRDGKIEAVAIRYLSKEGTLLVELEPLYRISEYDQ
jgi:hypothetical protein